MADKTETDVSKIKLVTEPTGEAEQTQAAAPKSRDLKEMSTDEFLKFLEEGSAEEILSVIPAEAPPQPVVAKLPWFKEALHVPEGERNLPATFMWWEGRRMMFNAIVGAVGLPFAILTLFMGLLPTFAIILGVLGYGITANLCYTLGPCAELVAAKLFGVERAKRLAPELLVLGLIFSVCVTIGGGVLFLITGGRL